MGAAQSIWHVAVGWPLILGATKPPEMHNSCSGGITTRRRTSHQHAGGCGHGKSLDVPHSMGHRWGSPAPPRVTAGSPEVGQDLWGFASASAGHHQAAGLGALGAFIVVPKGSREEEQQLSPAGAPQVKPITQFWLITRWSSCHQALHDGVPGSQMAVPASGGGRGPGLETGRRNPGLGKQGTGGKTSSEVSQGCCEGHQLLEGSSHAGREGLANPGREGLPNQRGHG